MPAKTRKRKASTMDMHKSDNLLVHSREPQSARKSTPIGKKSNMGEYSIDSGRNGSREFFFDASQVSRSGRAGVQEAKRVIRQKTDELVRYIDSHIEGSQLRGGIMSGASRLTPGVAPIFPYLGSPIVSKDTTGLLQKTSEGLGLVQSLVKEYRAMNATNERILMPTDILWEQDQSSMIALNKYAKDISIDMVTSVVMPHSDEELRSREKWTDEIEYMAWELLWEERPAQAGESWGRVAQGVARAFTAALKLLPKDDET